MKWQKGVQLKSNNKRAARLWLPVEPRMNLRSNMAIMNMAWCLIIWWCKPNRRCWLLLLPFNISKWRLEKSCKTIRYISMEVKWNNRRFDDLQAHQIKMTLVDTSSKLLEDLECQANSKGKCRDQHRSNMNNTNKNKYRWGTLTPNKNKNNIKSSLT